MVRTLLLTGLVLLSAASATPAQSGSEPRTVVEAVRLALRGASLDPDVLEAGLSGLERPVASDILALLQEGVLPAERDGEGQVLTRVQELFLQQALRARPSETRAVLTALSHDPRLGSDERVTALGVLGEIGRRHDLDLAIRLGAARGRAPEPATLAAFEGAVGRVLRRDPAAADELSGLLSTCPGPLVYPLVRTVAAGEPAPAARALADALGEAPSLDALLLLELGRVLESAPEVADERTGLTARSYLVRSDADLVLLAVQVTARMRDLEAVPTLIELLGSRDAGVRAAADDALKTVTGLSWRADAAAWAEWYRDEAAWWRHESGACASAIAHADPPQAAAAIRELARHRLHPDVSAAHLRSALQRPERTVLVHACQAYAALPPRDVELDPLVALLHSPEDDVRNAAWRALRRLTGHDLPPEHDAWAVLAARIRSGTATIR